MIKTKSLFVVMLFSLSIHLFGQKIVPADSKLQKIFGGGFFTEGPAASSNGDIYFSDQTFTSETNMEAGHIWKYSPLTGHTAIYRSPSGMANGLEIDKDDNLYACEGADFGGRRITKTDLKTGRSRIIAASYNGKPFNSPNDLTISSKGEIYFTDPRYTGHETVEQKWMGVYKIEKSGEVILLIDNISMPNGIALSPDGEKLYIACNDESNPSDNSGRLLKGMFIAEYKLLSSGGAESARKLIEFEKNAGPDGIAVDSKGNIYAAVRDENYPFIGIYSPDGKMIDEIKMPEVPSNITFGSGNYKSVLYITAGGSLYQIILGSEGLIK